MDTRKSRSWYTTLRAVSIAILVVAALGAPIQALAAPSPAPRAAPLLEEGTWVDNDRDGLDDVFEDTLMMKYAPEVRLHSCEDNLPASVEWYLPRVKMGFDMPQPMLNDNVLDTVTMSNLLTQVRVYDRPLFKGTFYSSGLEQAEHGQEAFQKTPYYLEQKGDLGTVMTTRAGQRDTDMYTAPTQTSRGAGSWPVYVHVRPAPSSAHPGLIEIQYFFFYPRNGGLGYIECNTAAGGQHEGDWEHVTVRVSADGNTPHDIAYASHGPSTWYGWNKPEKVGGTHPVVYSAFHSHASYPGPGQVVREGKPDDWTNDLGIVWDTSVRPQNVGERDRPRTGMEWIQYSGMWGGVQEMELFGIYPDGPTGPAIKGIWAGVEAEDDHTHGGIVVTPASDQIATATVQATFQLGSFVDYYSSAGPWTVRVLWGDGKTTTFTTSTTSGLSAVHTYSAAEAGYQVLVYVTNGFTAGSGSFNVGVGCEPDSRQAGPTYTVNRSSTCGWTCGVKSCDLTNAILAAEGDGVPSTINLQMTAASLLPPPSALWPSHARIGTQITINANGNHILRQSGPTPVTVSVLATGALTITHAIMGNQGTLKAQLIENEGTLKISSSTLTDDASTYSPSIAASQGGAIRNLGTLTISDSMLQEYAADEGGAIYNEGTTTISRSTLTDNTAESGSGGAIYNANGANLTITDSTLRDNQAQHLTGAPHGGGIYNLGALAVRGSTLARNRADGSGGGIYNSGSGSLNLLSSTLHANHAGSGGGIYNSATLYMLSSTLVKNTADTGPAIKNTGTATVKNTILASADPYPAPPGSHPAAPCSGTFAAGSIANVTNEEVSVSSCGTGTTASRRDYLKLGGLGSWGGPTETIEPLPSGSSTPNPALDKGDAVACLDPLLQGRDQRGYNRVADSLYDPDTIAQCDIGAFETNSTPLPPAPSPDDTPPAVGISLTPDTPDGSNGWYRSPLNASVLYMEYESQVVDVRCALDPAIPPTGFDDLPAETCPFLDAGTAVTADGPHTLYAAAMNEYGNKGVLLDDGSVAPFVSASFQIDATPPVLTCPAAGPFLLHSGNQPVGPAGVDASVSGLDEAASTLSGIVTTEAVGPKTLTFTAVDLAGNSASLACTYNVIYDFGGPYPPVAAGLNGVKAGQAVPVKFSLAGDQGMDVLAAAFSQPVACDTLAPAGDMAPAEWAGQSGLSYDPAIGWYSVVWKTANEWRGGCRGLTLELADGTQHAFYFDFR